MFESSKWLRFFLVGSVSAILVSAACSAHGPQSDAPYIEKKSQNENTIEIADCFSLGKWGERESCFSRQDDVEIENCETTRPLACKPYKEMYFAEKQIIFVEGEIKKHYLLAYVNYLTEDPDYVKDLEAFLRESSKSWASYRNAQCQLEPYVSGMSRREFGDIVEQCRVGKTQSRIIELESMLATLKTNQGY